MPVQTPVRFGQRMIWHAWQQVVQRVIAQAHRCPHFGQHARSVLAKLEAGRDATGGIAAGLDDLPLFAAASEPEPARDPLAEALATIEPDSLTPRAALDELYRLKRIAAEPDAG